MHLAETEVSGVSLGTCAHAAWGTHAHMLSCAAVCSWCCSATGRQPCAVGGDAGDCKTVAPSCCRHSCRANRRVSAFAALLCLMACCNALFVPLHLEDTVLRHPRTAGMQVVGRLPLWGSTTDLGTISNSLQQGTLNLTHSFVTQKAVSQFAKGKRGSLWRLGRLSDVVHQVEPVEAGPADVLTVAVPAAARHRGSSSFASWVASVEQGPWQHNSSWAAAAVDGLRAGLQDYRKECPRSDAFRFKHNAWKHHLDIFRMQVGWGWLGMRVSAVRSVAASDLCVLAQAPDRSRACVHSAWRSLPPSLPQTPPPTCAVCVLSPTCAGPRPPLIHPAHRGGPGSDAAQHGEALCAAVAVCRLPPVQGAAAAGRSADRHQRAHQQRLCSPGAVLVPLHMLVLRGRLCVQHTGVM